MASTLFDLVAMTPSSAFGTSATIPLGAAATISGVTYLSFAGAGATGGTAVSYSILDTGNSEIGTATYTSSNTTLTSRTPTKSTNGGAAIVATSAAIITGSVRGEDLNSFIVAGQLLGAATNDSASAGNVGEFIEATSSTVLKVSIATGGVNNVEAITVTPGDWRVYGVIYFFPPSSATTVTDFQTCVSLVSSTQDVGVGNFAQLNANNISVGSGTNSVGLPVPRRVSVTANTSVFLVGSAIYSSTGTVACGGKIHAIRVR